MPIKNLYKVKNNHIKILQNDIEYKFDKVLDDLYQYQLTFNVVCNCIPNVIIAYNLIKENTNTDMNKIKLIAGLIDDNGNLLEHTWLEIDNKIIETSIEYKNNKYRYLKFSNDEKLQNSIKRYQRTLDNVIFNNKVLDGDGKTYIDGFFDFIETQ